MEAKLLMSIGLLSWLLCGDSWAQDAAPLARPDWEEHLAAVEQAAEGYLREATQSGDVRMSERGYLQAQRYYRHALLLSPLDPAVLASERVVAEQLARFQRQYRWERFKMGAVHLLRGTPETRELNDGKALGIGRAVFSVDAEAPVLEELAPEKQWTLSHSRRRVPFLFQIQGGLGVAQEAADGLPTADLIAGHVSAEVDYTVLPMLRFLLPYIGFGYQGILGRYDESGADGNYFFHGTFLRLGVAISPARALKVALDYSRSVEIYGSQFNTSERFEERGVHSCTDCFGAWRATQISVEFLF